MSLFNINIPETLTKFLEYGIPGLCAIILLLAYNLLRTQNKKETPNDSMLRTIKSFMWIALVFAIVSGTVTIIEKQIESKTQFEIVEKEKERSTNSLAIATANSMAKELAVLNRNHSYSGSTGSVGKGGGGGYGSPETISDPILSERITFEDYNYKKLKRAIFLSIQYCGANTEVLKQAFLILERRGYQVEENSKSRLLSEFKDLIKLRYQWLEKTAIPKGQKGLDDFPQEIQEEPYSMVSIPKELWLFSSYEDNEEPAIRIEFGEIDIYRNELLLLKNQIK